LVVLDERPVAQLADRGLQFGLGVHHDRSVPGDGLLERAARAQQAPDTLLAGLHDDLVATVEHDERAVAGLLPRHVLDGPGLVGRRLPRH
jgi:hypothetical protein